MKQKLIPQILKTKRHFAILDGLRGLAALAVVLFHFMEMAYLDYSKNFIAHGFLAVDFFFCLSGFVIAYAYDDRITKMGVIEFFKSRLIRLHPLVILGSILGLLTFLFDPFSTGLADYSTGKIFALLMSSIVLIPFPVMQERSFNLFGLNAPSWSLFWEYIANITYAFILHRTSKRVLFILLGIAAIALCYTDYHAGGSLMGGWGKANFWDGGARVFYSFLAGILVYRANWIIKSNFNFTSLSLLLVLAFVMPFNSWNWLTELLVVLFYFPLIVALGAGIVPNPKEQKICTFSGKISYPLYMTHYAVIWVFLNYYNSYKPATAELALIIGIATLLLLAFAYLVMVVYDIPVRNYLTDKRKKSLQ